MSVQFYTHSDYSLLKSVLTVESLVNEAKRLKIKYLALTDHNSTAGHGEFEELCIKANINPIFGLELDVFFSSKEHVVSVVFIAQNSQGYANLLRLASKPFPVSWETLSKFREGLVLLEGGQKGQITRLLRSGKKEEALKLHNWYSKQYGENYYLRYELGQKEEFWTIFPQHKIILCQDIRHVNVNSGEALELLAQMGSFEAEIPKYPFLNWDQLIDTFVGPSNIITTTLELAESCKVRLPRERILPPHPGEENLDTLVWERAIQRFGQIEPAVRERLDYELKIINDLKYNDYFLIVADLVSFAKNANIPVGPGRGSAASSMVAYCLGITEINSLHWGLLFERFLNKERQNRPDIDIDFCYERRNEVIAYAVERFGEAHVAQIGTYGTFGVRSAQQEVKRHLGQNNPALAKEIQGLKRHQSTHAAGIIITGQPIQNISATYPKREFPITHLDMYSLEALGALKIDILGLRTLTFLNKVEQEIQKNDVDFSLTNIPLEDKATFELLSQGKTLGLFQLESTLFRDLLRKMKPNSFHDLVALLALGRPGPLNIFPEYLKRRKNSNKISYFHPKLQEILEETYGFILYQEQVMLIAHHLGGFSLGEADLLRRALGKDDHQAIQGWKERFIKGAKTKSGLSCPDSERIFKMIAEFSGYAFNKAHSVSYALITWRAAYLKARYPREFYVTMLQDGSTGKELTSLLLDCQSLGVEVLGPSVLYSQKQAILEGDSIRLGLCTNRQLTPRSADQIIQYRKKHKMFNWAKFREHVKLDQKSLENLVYSGALDDLMVRHSLIKELDFATQSELELLHAERRLLGIHASRHPTTVFMPLIQNLQGKLDAITGKVLEIQSKDSRIQGVLESPKGAVLFNSPPALQKQGLVEGQFVALFGNSENGFLQVNWFLKLGPTLLITPRQDELETIKTILSEEFGTHPVVLRLGEEVAYHLLPKQFWVKNTAKIEQELKKAKLVYVWFDPWKEKVS